MSESGPSAEPQAELNSEQGHSDLGSVEPADGDIEGDGNEEIVQKHCEKRQKPANDKGTGSKNKDGSRQERKWLKGRARSGNETADEEGINENVPTKRKGKGTGMRDTVQVEKASIRGEDFSTLIQRPTCQQRTFGLDLNGDQEEDGMVVDGEETEGRQGRTGISLQVPDRVIASG
ncbi:hypothetical protein PAXINDRAFT_157784 [Paxillus involutus ATCC 200175]|uniref:Uncharacterized protein n=1 Tax=Paxillus involutus ATCC 200175 TaxID=664439 RepID=A0A0C9TQ50_PAXIN|nr:hypothetical protein PAXINDRAFT_157784 [Paxillus involutus ATCC 200175]